MQAHNALIHVFDGSQSPPQLDDDGDPMLGCYYQFTGEDGDPIGGLIGPYPFRVDAEKAAKQAFERKDF